MPRGPGAASAGTSGPGTEDEDGVGQGRRGRPGTIRDYPASSFMARASAVSRSVIPPDS